MTLFQCKVAAIREKFPKHTPTALSLAQRSQETGVCLVPEAQEIADSIDRVLRRSGRRSDKRYKSVRFSCRLTPAAAELVKEQMAACGISSVQTLVEALLLGWAKAEKEPLTAGTVSGSGVGNNPQTAPDSDDNTNV